ncbi:MAG: hypothetical protein GXN92_03740 [Candidatus Micrarchaeota archaeon]|nr:hypothetical protein [Candidatus Micrarchaeota archaeon]
MGKVFYTVADTHFGDVVVLRFRNREKRRFDDVNEMNRVLLKVWKEITSDGSVIFVGDMARDESPFPWLKRLPRNLSSFIMGNHDRINGHHPKVMFANFYRIRFNGKTHKFAFIHNPRQFNRNQNGHILVHGHIHNHKDYPFWNGKKRWANVAADRTAGLPVPLTLLAHLDQLKHPTVYSLWDLDPKLLRLHYMSKAQQYVVDCAIERFK